MRKIIVGIICAGLILHSLCENAFSYDDVITHRDISDQAAKVENSKLDSYLKSNLGFNDGLDTRLSPTTDTTIIDLIKKGSKEEDDPDCRASNH